MGVRLDSEPTFCRRSYAPSAAEIESMTRPKITMLYVIIVVYYAVLDLSFRDEAKTPDRFDQSRVEGEV